MRDCSRLPTVLIVIRGFVDSLLDHLTRECAADNVPVGDEGMGTGPRLVGGMYANELKGLTQFTAGLQRVLDVVRAHSLKLGWTLNVRRTVIMVFSGADARAAHAGIEFRWESEVLQRVPDANFLGLHVTEDLTWGEHVRQVANKGWGALHR